MAKDKKYGFGQGSGSDLVDANIAAEPIRNLPSALKVELKKILKRKKGAKRMKEGGEAVPAKFKGFSKLPEGVQQKMDPDLAQKYEKGGAVGSCRGMGAAMRGGKFSGVR